MAPVKPRPRVIPHTSIFFSGFKLGYGDVGAHFQLRSIVQLQFPQVTRGSDAGLFEVTSHRFVNQFLSAVLRQGVKTDLHGLVTVAFHVLFLHYLAGACLHHGHGNEAAVIGEDLRHADLLAYDRFFHDSVPPA